MNACIDDNTLCALVERAISDGERSSIVAHIEECDACRELVAQTLRDDGPAPLARGQNVGRYVVLDFIGAGSMGVVYAAYDPDLDRKIAIKLLHSDASEAARESLRARLVREARAIAKLAHPNVVNVFDVGTLGGEVFVAMEFVAGDTAFAWLRRAPRTWREILRVFRDAGEGLSAAHRAGIVHRDFKPENMLVGTDGRVRVTDFGLARSGEEDLAGGPRPGPIAALANVGSRSEGAFAGTPAYMAPEQIAGAPATVQSDVYAFSVTLYEALFDARPFAGTTLGELHDAATTGNVKVAALPRGAPAGLRDVILRGLRARPKDRWESMPAMLDALARTERKARWPLWVGGALLALLAVVFATRARIEDPHQGECTGAELAFGDAWSDGRRAEVRAALGRALGVRGEGIYGAVDRTLARYRAAWIAMHADACRATRVRGEQSEATRDLRMACLEERRREVSSLTHLLASIDGSDPNATATAERSLVTAQQLPDIGFCSNVAALAAREPPPADPALRESIAQVEQGLAETTVRVHLRPPDETGPRVDLLVEEARRLGYRALLSRALVQQAEIARRAWNVPKAREAAAEAAVLALEVKDDATAADAWITLTEVDGQHGRFEESERSARLAQAMIARLGGDSAREGRRLLAQCNARIAYADDFSRAKGLCEGARTQIFDAKGPDDLDLARVETSLGHIAYIEARFADALALHRGALALRTRLLGAEHEQRDMARSNIAEQMIELGQVDHAIAEMRDLAARHPDHAIFRGSLAAGLRRRGDFEGARAEAAAAIAVCERNHDSVYEAMMRAELAVDLLGAGRAREALEAIERTLASNEPLTPTWTAHAALTFARAVALVRPADLARARVVAARGAHAIREFAEQHGGPYRELLRALDAWLDAHPVREIVATDRRSPRPLN